MRRSPVSRLRQHRVITILLGAVLILGATVTTVTYLGNEALEMPEAVSLLADRGWLGVGADCRNDPAGLPVLTDSDTGRPLQYLYTCAGRLVNSDGHEVTITGINWFGMETGTRAPHGLWLRNWQTVLDQIAALGYNAIRLPFSNEILDDNAVVRGINYAVNPDLAGLNSLRVLDNLIDGARKRGLRVVLDRHRPTSAGQTPLWYSDDVGEQRWIEDWVRLARRYAYNDAVIGFDLHNEPRDHATWGSNDVATDWRLAAERAADAILETNPYLLIFVQGVANFQGDYYWWGGQLAGVAEHPVRLRIPNRVVYSPHDYGPEVFEQGWFKDPSFPRNLPSIWNSHWGYIVRRGLAPVVVGEFGGRSVGSDPEGIWQRALLDYMQRNRVGFFNWSLNPNSSDTGGVLSEDWLSIVEDKQNVYSGYLARPIGQSRPASPTDRLRVLYRAMNIDPKTANVAFSVQLANDGSQPVDLSRLELRYWLRAGTVRKGQQIAEVDYSALGKDRVTTEVVSSKQGGQDSYVRIGFQSGTPHLEAYQHSGEIMVRVHKPDWSTYDQAAAFSFTPRTEWLEWNRVALYRDGRLLWGKEPDRVAESSR